MSNTALLALSSPEGSDNYYSQLINLRDDNTGLPFFKVVDCFLICEACRKLERDEQVKCNHVKQKAHWLSKRKGERLKMLYKNDPATAIREMSGIIEDDFSPCFPKDDVKRMFERPPISTRYIPKQIYTAVDPNGGGPSQLAIVSGYYDADNNFVVSNPIFFLLDSHQIQLASSQYEIIYGGYNIAFVIGKIKCSFYKMKDFTLDFLKIVGIIHGVGVVHLTHLF